MLGVIFFLLIIAGMVLNTIFLVREIRRNEQHDSFINAVTHELKTPVASIRLYLETLQARELDEAKRREFYRIMLEDSDRLLHTIEQVLRAGSIASRPRLGRSARTPINLAELVRECVELARTRFRLDADALTYDQRLDDGRAVVSGDVEELKTAVWNLIDNAIKYSPQRTPYSRVARRGRRPAAGPSRARQRGRDFARRAEARVPPLLPGADLGGCPLARQQRSRPLHRPVGRAPARREGLRVQRGHRPGQHLHAAPAESDTGMTATGHRILIVEDEHHLAEGLRFNLEAEGYGADVVDTGEAALQRLIGPERQPYDVVVLDVMLPGKDGFAVVAELRRPGSSCRY